MIKDPLMPMRGRSLSRIATAGMFRETKGDR
jgi:hypothetical protein